MSCEIPDSGNVLSSSRGEKAAEVRGQRGVDSRRGREKRKKMLKMQVALDELLKTKGQ